MVCVCVRVCIHSNISQLVWNDSMKYVRACIRLYFVCKAMFAIVTVTMVLLLLLLVLLVVVLLLLWLDRHRKQRQMSVWWSNKIERRKQTFVQDVTVSDIFLPMDICIYMYYIYYTILNYTIHTNTYMQPLYPTSSSSNRLHHLPIFLSCLAP